MSGCSRHPTLNPITILHVRLRIVSSSRPHPGLVCLKLRRASQGHMTAGDKLEEGEDDVKSSCPLCPRRHTCLNGRDKGSRAREGELTPKTRPQFGLQAATCLHEAGIASNRRSAIRR
ncbi:hypothetical protein SAY86_020467 [Trapa natans]|uniref:Uncharacterized protein n=1 Tax=Trapa natans TaxID=22666 RepID=A0AAN7LJ27_TRANT|nr:hypothetical protein SAY86_020467 [Trapa natans]